MKNDIEVVRKALLVANSDLGEALLALDRIADRVDGALKILKKGPRHEDATAA